MRWVLFSLPRQRCVLLSRWGGGYCEPPEIRTHDQQQGRPEKYPCKRKQAFLSTCRYFFWYFFVYVLYEDRNKNQLMGALLNLSDEDAREGEERENSKQSSSPQ